jgi:hypothetical protein
VEWLGDIGKSFDELAVEVAKSNELSDTSDILGFLPGTN